MEIYNGRRAVAMTGVHVMLEMLAGCGTRYLFGNPGTTELPLSDAMADGAA